jgi:type I restriction enzyme M protein
MTTLSEILRDSDYRHTQFDLVLIHEFERKIIIRTDKNGKEIPYINCAIRKKEIRLTPEEAIRQLYLENILYK